MTRRDAEELRLGDKVRLKGSQMVMEVAGPPYQSRVTPGSKKIVVNVSCWDGRGTLPGNYTHNQIERIKG